MGKKEEKAILFQQYISDSNKISTKLNGSTITGGNVVLSRFLNNEAIIKDVEFEGALSIQQYSVNDKLVFINSKFGFDSLGVSLNIASPTGNEIAFQNCEFRGSVTVYSPNVNTILFYGCTFHQDVKITGTSSKEDHTHIMFGRSDIQLCKFNKGLIFTDLHFVQITIRDVVFQKDISVHGAFTSKMFIANGTYHDINIFNCKALKQLTIQGDNENVEELSINKFNAPLLGLNGKILIRNAAINEIDLSSFQQNEGIVQLQNVKILSQTKLNDSDFKRILFNEVDLTSAKVSFDNSYIGDCVFSNMKWPTGKKMVTLKELIVSDTGYKATIKEILVLREVYRQLKNVMKSQSNNIDALEFYRNEMEMYWKQIKIDMSVSKWDKFIVFVNKTTSDFGLSLKKPLLFLLLFHSILMFILALLQFDGLTINFINPSLSATEKFFGDFFVLLNPAHKFMDGQTGGVLIVDFLIRLFSGFFIFHIIRATRKFSRL